MSNDNPNDNPKEIALQISQELTEDPTRWCQGHPAIDAQGRQVSTEDPNAAAWCLWGHLAKRNVLFGKTFDAFSKHITPLGMGTWNDQPKRTVQDIIDVCQKVADDEEL